MTYEFLLGLTLFALVASITPGPNNLMLMASGANYGFQRTLPHMLGIALGFVVMVMLVGAGLSEFIATHPLALDLLRVLCVAYLGYLALGLVSAQNLDADGASLGKPLTFLQAALFQWVNPKAWAMALTAISVYAPDASLTSLGLVAVVFGLVNLPSVSLWAMLGQQLQGLLAAERNLRCFNVVAAMLLLVSLLPMLDIV